jgi:integrase
MAMDLLQAGVDRAVIALWLGHESVETTQIYPPRGEPGRYQPGDRLLGFLNNL